MNDSDGTVAPGPPGSAPTWSSSDKDTVGTSHYASRVWFTIGHGVLNEVYWPHVDRPQVRDLGFIVADDAGFWSEVKRDASHAVRQEAPGVPAITAVHSHPRYELTLRICADDHADVVRIEARLTDRRDAADPDRVAHPLRLYPLLAPHLGFGGLSGHAWSGEYKGRAMLFAQNGQWALALASDPGPARQSVGYVGTSDGWQDFAANGRMTWTHTHTDAGNVAGMTELVLDGGAVQLALAFGARADEAGLQACAALAGHFQSAWDEYVGNWHAFVRTVVEPPSGLRQEDRDLYLTSASVLRSLQDRTLPGATVASLSIPWGNTRNDLGGYHLVWSRDLVESAGAFVALGAEATARRTLAYLVASQEPDGHWPQNQWVDGDPHWNGMQLDETAYPLLLAGALDTGASHMHGRTGSDAAIFESLVTKTALDRDDRASCRLHRPDRPRHRTGPLGGDRGPLPIHPGAGCRRPRGRRRTPGRTGRLVLPRARRRLERLDRGLDVRPRHRPRPRAWRGRLLRADCLAGCPCRCAHLHGGHGAEPTGGGIANASRRDGRHGLPVAGAVRAPPARRSPDRLEPRGRGCHPPDGDAERSRLAPLQRRRLRRARRRERVRRNGDRSRLADPGRRAWPLRAGRRARRTAVPRDDAAHGLGRGHAARAGLGCRPDRGARPGPRAAERLGDAAGVGSRRVREAGPLDRPGPCHRSSRGRLEALPRPGPNGDPRDLAVHGAAALPGGWSHLAPGADGSGTGPLLHRRPPQLGRSRCSRHGPRSMGGRRARFGRAGARSSGGLHVLVAGAGRWEGRDLRVEVSPSAERPDAPGAARIAPAGSP